MHNVPIPNTDLNPSVLCLGTGNMGATIDRETSFAMLDAFIENDGNFLDTARVYSDWIPGETSRSEKLLGAWMKKRKNRRRAIVATKGAHPDLRTMNVQQLSPQEIESDVNASLENLQIDTIDLYWLHRDDPTRPVAEIMETLAAQAKSGKIRYYGCSNWRLDRIQAAQACAAGQRYPGFAGVQNLWNLAKVNRESLTEASLAAMDQSLWDYHKATRLAAIPYSSQANGLFQKLESGQAERIAPSQREMFMNSETQARFRRVLELKAQTGFTISQIVLGYLTGQPFPTIPVIGPKNMDQLEDSLSGADVALTVAQIGYLEGTGS